MDYKRLQMWIENIGFCKKPSIVFSLCWENFSELYHLYLKKTIIRCKLHYLNLFMNHLKFNVSFDFFTTILSVFFVFDYFEINIESVKLKRWFWWWQKCPQLVIFLSLYSITIDKFGKVLVSCHCTGKKCTSSMMPEIGFPSSLNTQMLCTFRLGKFSN